MHNITTILARFAAVEHDVYSYLAASPSAQRIVERDSQRLFAAISVKAGGGKTPYLLARQDAVAKLGHNAHITEWEQVIMYLSAEKSSGVANLCPWATPQCVAGCLQSSGHLGMSHGQTAMLARTLFMLADPFGFLVTLIKELRNHAKRIHGCGKRIVARLNGTSDIPWERLPWLTAALDDIVDMRFDYTKGHRRESTDAYYLAKSVTEKMLPEAVEPGMVVVTDAKRGDTLPDTWAGMPVIDGDHENGDLRFLDRARPDAVVLLRGKGDLRGVDGDVYSFVKPAEVAVPVTVR